MKRLIPIFLLSLSIVSCTNPEKKANAAIKEFLKTKPIDLALYQPLSNVIDTAYNLVVYNEDLYELCLDYTKAKNQAERSYRDIGRKEDSRDNYADVRHYSWGRRSYNKYSEEVREAKAAYILNQATYIQSLEKILDIIDCTDENKVIGWRVLHNLKYNGEVIQVLVILNPEMDRVLHFFTDNDDIEYVQEKLKEIVPLRYELSVMKENLEAYKEKNK